MSIYDNVQGALGNLAYDVSQAQRGIRTDTPLWKVQEYLDALSYSIDRLRKGEYE